MSHQPPRALRFAVISMGFVLIGGFVFVLATLAERIFTDTKTTVEMQSKPSDCAQLELTAQSASDVSYENGFWIIRAEKTLKRYDQCGRLVQTVIISEPTSR